MILFIVFSSTFIFHLFLRRLEVAFSKTQFINIEPLMENCSFRAFVAFQFYVAFENVLAF